MNKGQSHKKESVSMEATEKGESQYRTTHQSTSTESGETGNIEKVRDILFGSQVRDIEKKHARLKEDIFKEVAHLREETTKHFESLENYFKKEVAALSEQLKVERDSLDKTSRELRQDILDQSKKLSEDIRNKITETTHLFEQRFNELREDKVDRSSLSTFFTEIAIKISDDLAHELNQASKDSVNE